MTDEKDEIFPEISADAENITTIESLCLRCHEQGVTRLLLTKIPFFREVVVSSFECKECHHHDSCIQSGSSLQEKGVKYTLKVISQKDLNRQVVKSEHAVICIPELDFEQPPSKKGDITTVEGLLDSIIEGINYLQEERRKADAELAGKLDTFVAKVAELKLLKHPFTLVLDDPAGNSFIENPFTPSSDPFMQQSSYTRTKQQTISLGYAQEEEDEISETTDNNDIKNPANEEGAEDWNFKGEVFSFPTQCPSCNASCETNMKMIDIPYFKQVVVMATVCDSCGHRDNEVKAGVGVEAKGHLISLSIVDDVDLNRDVLKSETASVKIPELDFEMVGGTLGGRFTTIEGLLTQVKEQLSGNNPFLHGDSSDDSARSKVDRFCQKLDQIIKGDMRYVHMELDDPAGNSYVQSLKAPLEDPRLVHHYYQRSKEQDDELGINDMKTDNY